MKQEAECLIKSVIQSLDASRKHDCAGFDCSTCNPCGKSEVLKQALELIDEK